MTRLMRLGEVVGAGDAADGFLWKALVWADSVRRLSDKTRLLAIIPRSSVSTSSFHENRTPQCHRRLHLRFLLGQLRALPRSLDAFLPPVRPQPFCFPPCLASRLLVAPDLAVSMRLGRRVVVEGVRFLESPQTGHFFAAGSRHIPMSDGGGDGPEAATEATGTFPWGRTA